MDRTPTELATTDTRVKLLQRTLERGGWELLYVDIDLVNERARVGLKCGPVHVTLDAERSRATLTRELWSPLTYSKNANVYLYNNSVELLGRSRYEGARAGLRGLCNYVEDNGTRPFAKFEVRNAMRLLMS